jgi:hypothetical protein
MPTPLSPTCTHGGFRWVICDHDHLLYRDGECHGIAYQHASEGYAYLAPRPERGTLERTGYGTLAEAKMGLLVHVAGLVIRRHERELGEIGRLVRRDR